MTSANSIRARLAERGWPVAGAPTGLLRYIVLVDLVAVGGVTAALLDMHPSLDSLGLLGLLSLMAVVFEEGVRRAARLQLRVSADLKRDMTSVWAVAAAAALPSWSGVLLLGVVLTYIWFRQQRPAGEPLHRKIFNASAVLISCLAAGLIVRTSSTEWSHAPWALGAALSVLVALIAYAAANRVLVTLALVVMRVRGRALLGGRDDNLIELATLCLGGLVAIAASHEPWLCILVLAPMVALQRGALVRELETAATIDSKTGLLNAVAWEHVLSRELARAAREDKPLAVLIIDIDRFKLVNDRFGHIAGDAVLREVGRCLQSGLREFDTIGRFGGEEFVAVLPSAGDSEGLVVAERLRSRVAALPLASIVDSVDDADELHLSVSVGVSTSPTDGAELQELLVAADAALYKAKAAGRNRVVLAERGTGPAFEPVARS